MASPMETFSTLLTLCEGNSPVIGEFPSQRPVTQSFDVFFGLRQNNKNCWVNDRDAGDLRRHRAHYDVSVIIFELAIHTLYCYLKYWCDENIHMCILNGTMSIRRSDIARDSSSIHSGWLTHWPLGHVVVISKVKPMNSCYIWSLWALPMKLISGACYRTPLVTSQHWFRWWIVAVEAASHYLNQS